MKLSDVQKENGSSEIAKTVCKLLKKEGMLAKKVTLVTVYTLNHFQQLVQRVKESLPRATELEVMDAITRWKNDRSKRNEEAMIDVLFIFRGDRSKPELWGGIRSRKRFIDTAKKKAATRLKLPTGIMLYLRLAKQHYDQQGAIKDQNMHVAKHIAALFPNERVTPEEIMDRAGAGDGLGMKKDVSGAAARGKAQGIWRDLVCIAYQEGIEVKSFDQKSVIEHCQDMEKTFERVKGRDKQQRNDKMVPLASKIGSIKLGSKANIKINLDGFPTNKPSYRCTMAKGLIPVVVDTAVKLEQ